MLVCSFKFWELPFYFGCSSGVVCVLVLSLLRPTMFCVDLGLTLEGTTGSGSGHRYTYTTNVLFLWGSFSWMHRCRVGFLYTCMLHIVVTFHCYRVSLAETDGGEIEYSAGFLCCHSFFAECPYNRACYVPFLVLEGGVEHQQALDCCLAALFFAPALGVTMGV